MGILILAVSWFSRLITFALMLRALLSWFAQNPYSGAGRLYMFTVKFTEPIVSPCRTFLSRFNTGMLDLSVLMAFLLVELAANIIIRILILI